MPVFRGFWGWAAFAVLAIVALVIVVATTERDGFGDFVVAVARRVEPLWISLAILVYTAMEGVIMLAEAFKRHQFERGETKGFARGLSAVEEAARRQGMSPEDIRRVIEEARKIVQNRRS